MSECWHCGRAVPDWAGTAYVFGVVCDRRECRELKSALNPRFKKFWFRACLPGPNASGRAGSFDLNGEPNWPSGITEMSMQKNIDSKRRLQERGSA